MFRARVAAFSIAVAACASQAREPFSIDELVADAPAYVAARYRASELPTALIAELTTEEFQCQHAATTSECDRSRHAIASCWDVISVRISAEVVRAEQSRRCMGAQQP